MRPSIFVAAVAAAPLIFAAPPASSQIIEGVEGVMLTLATIFEGARLFVPSNDKLDPANTNVFVGFQPQVDCTAEGRFMSAVVGGGGLPCVPDQQYPPLGAGLQRLAQMAPEDCEYKQSVSAASLQNTVVPRLQATNPISGVGFGSPSNPGGYITAGVCSPSGSIRYSFVGYLLGQYTIIAVDLLSLTQCAYLVNMCTGPCSCGPFAHNP